MAAFRFVRVDLLLQDNYHLGQNESLLLWLFLFGPLWRIQKSVFTVCAVHTILNMRLLLSMSKEGWCWSYEFMSSSLSPPSSPSVRWGSMMKPGWSSNRSTTPTCERVGNRRKSSLWVSVSTVRCLSWFSWCLRKQRGLYSATAGTGLNAFTVQDHMWIAKVLKVSFRLICLLAALWESLIVNMFLEFIIYSSRCCLRSPLWFWFDFNYIYHV